MRPGDLQSGSVHSEARVLGTFGVDSSSVVHSGPHCPNHGSLRCGRSGHPSTPPGAEPFPRKPSGPQSKGGRDGNSIGSAPCCRFRTGTKLVYVRARQGHSSAETGAFDGMLGLRRRTDVRRRARIRLSNVLESVAYPLDPVPMVAARDHERSSQTLPLAVLSRRSRIA